MEYFHDRQEFSGIICEITIILFVGGQAGPAGRILSIIIYNPRPACRGQPLLALLSFLLLCVALVTINHPRCQHRAARRAAPAPAAARTQCSGGIFHFSC